MKSVVVGALGAVLSFALGWLCWTAAQLERRVAGADRQLAMLQYSDPIAEYDDIEDSIGSLRRVPWLADDVLADARRHRATARYWLADYAPLALERDTNGKLIEKDPEILFVGANALYRSTRGQAGDRQALIRRLDAVISSYADLMKEHPGYVKASYNYEYVARVRDGIARGRSPQQFDLEASASEGDDSSDDLPQGSTLHGEPGAPPPDKKMEQFKVFAPMRPEEREAIPDDAGKGQKKVRKG